MRKLHLAWLIAAPAIALLPQLGAQSFDASQWTQGVISIDAPWRFHTGDDPDGRLGWASPGFDDSAWPLQTTDKFWNLQGYRGYSGYAWYRLRLKLPATTQPLGVNIGHINSAAEIYADGRLIGANGIMRPRPQWSEQMEANAFPLPLSSNGNWVEIAVRVWKSPVASSYSGGGFHAHPIVGSLPLLQAARRIALDDSFAGFLAPITVDLLCLVLGCFGLGLFLLDRRSTEYAWFAVWGIGTAALDFVTVAIIQHQGSVTFVRNLSLLDLPLYFAELLFLWGFMKTRPDWILGLAMAFNTAIALGDFLANSAVISLPAGQSIAATAGTLFFAMVIVRVIVSLRAGNRDARLLVLPVCLMAVGTVVESFRIAIFYAGLSHNRGDLIFWSNGVISIDWNDAFRLLFLTSIAVALILRFARSTNEERRLSAELAAASEIQAKLVPAQLPSLPGLHVEAAYRPATEVGGDFYQAFPLKDQSALIVVGDVSGKGLKAAMTATLALGALRALAQENLPPAQILSRLNSQLTGSADGGFITCLCARIAPDGTVTLANAGHLAPYLGGRELTIENGLPVGLAAHSAYAESTFRLPPGAQLTLISDGVIEARNAGGELFGFERTAAISAESAQSIARAASAFGQEDDITVLTLTRLPAVFETAYTPTLRTRSASLIKP